MITRYFLTLFGLVLLQLFASPIYSSTLFVSGGAGNYYTPSTNNQDGWIGSLNTGFLMIRCPTFLVDLGLGSGEHSYVEIRTYFQTTCQPKREARFNNLGKALGKVVDAMFKLKILHLYLGIAGTYFLQNNNVNSIYFSPIVGLKSFEFWQNRLYFEFSTPIIGTSEIRYFRFTWGLERRIEI